MEDADHLDRYLSTALLYTLVRDCRLRREIRVHIYSCTMTVYIILMFYYKTNIRYNICPFKTSKEINYINFYIIPTPFNVLLIVKSIYVLLCHFFIDKMSFLNHYFQIVILDIFKSRITVIDFTLHYLYGTFKSRMLNSRFNWKHDDCHAWKNFYIREFGKITILFFFWVSWKKTVNVPTLAITLSERKQNLITSVNFRMNIRWNY